VFKAFNLQLDNISYDATKSDYKDIKKNQNTFIEQKIKNFIRPNGVLDGELMQSDWFPLIDNVDIFISHSHIDEDNAIKLASYLYDRFNMVSFIDSLVWKNSRILLKLIDDEFCKNEDGLTYDYSRRNQSTSHVNMMLSVALTEMIDKSECLFFLNTPASITPYDSVVDGTISPWIFSELSMTKLVRKKLPCEHRPIDHLLKKAFESRADTARAMVLHKLPTDHLIPLTYQDIEFWSQEFDGKQVHALDVLYELKGIS
jgi:hypothetical protein